MTTESLKLLSEELSKEKDILFAYIFGSQATGKTHVESDIDLAVYLEPFPENTFERRLELIDKISQITGFNKIDLVILNEAPLLLIHSVMQTGKLLFCKDPGKRIRFMAKKLTEALDFDIHLRIYRDAIKKELERINLVSNKAIFKLLERLERALKRLESKKNVTFE